MASFDRLLSLAKKTGDRLIVFDSHTGTGFAAIPIDEYEKMMTDPRDISSLSGDELIEQINRDIGAWRDHKEQEDDELDILFDTPSRYDDPFGNSTWESAGDVLHGRYWMDEDDVEEEFDEMDLFETYNASEEEPELSFDFAERGGEVFGDVGFEPEIEPLPHPIPSLPQEPEGVWEEEPLDDDPVFFEEPV